MRRTLVFASLFTTIFALLIIVWRFGHDVKITLFSVVIILSLFLLINVLDSIKSHIKLTKRMKRLERVESEVTQQKVQVQFAHKLIKKTQEQVDQ